MATYAALVSGGTGFVGSRIAAALLADGAAVRILSSGTIDRSRLGRHAEKVEWFGIEDADLDIATRDVCCFFNFAVAYDRPTITDEVLEAVNVGLPLRILARLQAQGQPVTCVLGDSFFRKFPPEATRQPRYTQSKNCLAEHLRTQASQFEKNLRVALLQIEQVYGPGEAFTKVFPRLTRAMLENVPRLAATHGQQRRDFVHVDDVAAAALTIAKTDWRGLQTAECGTGTSTTVREVLERLKVLTRSHTALGFGDLPPDQAIDASSANVAWLSSLGWTRQVALADGLTELVRDVTARMAAEP